VIASLARFGTEEILRRAIPRDATVPTRENILDLLFPRRADTLENFKHAFNKHLKDQIEKSSKKDVDVYAQHSSLIEDIKKKTGGSKVEEESKEP